jgi:hypothetical protein
VPKPRKKRKRKAKPLLDWLHDEVQRLRKKGLINI